MAQFLVLFVRNRDPLTLARGCRHIPRMRRLSAIGGTLAALMLARPSNADTGDFETHYEPDDSEKRSGLLVVLETGTAMGSISGYPNHYAKMDVDEYYVASPVGFGSNVGGWVGAIPRDWFSFGIGFTATSYTTNAGDAAGFMVGIRGEVYPLYSQGGFYKDWGLLVESGAGRVTLESEGETDPIVDGGSMSSVSTGTFFEAVEFWQMNVGPQLRYTYQFGNPATAHTTTLSLRIGYHSGP